jgi:SAM-dependent methyltransferase
MTQHEHEQDFHPDLNGRTEGQATRGADPQAFKAKAREQWDRSAQGWNDHTPQIRAWLRAGTDAMLDMAGVRLGGKVLDVAAGAGDQTLDIARRVGPSGQVLCTDLSPEILSLALANAERAGLHNVTTLVADGEALPVESGAFDSAVCRLGLMLFPEPRRALRELHRATRPGGGVCVMVFGRPDRNPCITTLMATALKHAGLPPPDPSQPGGLLSLGRPGLLDKMFKDAGFHAIATTTVDAPFRLPSAHHYIDFVRSSASPIQQILGRLGPEAAKAAWQDIGTQLAQFATEGAWIGPNELLLTAARR